MAAHFQHNYTINILAHATQLYGQVQIYWHMQHNYMDRFKNILAHATQLYGQVQKYICTCNTIIWTGSMIKICADAIFNMWWF